MQLTSWIAFVFSLAGAILAAHKIRWCWVVWFGANAAWILYAMQTKQPALVLTEVVFVVLNVYGLIKWRGE